MIKMKDSGIPWIGQIPENWKVARVKDFSFLSDKKNTSKDPIVLSLARDAIKIRDITNNEGQLAKSYDNYCIVKKGDFVLNPMDLYSGANCNVSFVEGVISPAYSILKIKNNYDVKLLDYFFKTLYWQMILYSYGKGVSADNRWTLTKENLLNIPLPCPPKEIQQKIVVILDKKCGQIDELVRIEENEIEKLKEYKTSLITKVVTKGLDHNAKMKDSGIPWIGQIPEDWKVVRLKNIAKCYGGLTYSPDDINEKGILVLRSSNIQNGKLSFNDNVYVKVNNFMPVEKNDILICSRNGSRELIGKNAIITTDIKATFGAFMMIIRTSQNAKYLHKILNSNIFNYYISSFLTSTINQLTKNNLDNIKFPFSIDPNTQQQIVEYLDKRCEEIDNLIKIKQEKIEKLKEYKKSLIYQYVTGKKEV